MGKSRMMQQSWNRKWFVLEPLTLSFVKSPMDLDPEPICDILLATVREAVEVPPTDGGDAEAAEAPPPAAENTAGGGSKSGAALPFSFEILSATRKGEMLQATGPKELAEWTGAIRNCIEKQLETGEAQPGGADEAGAVELTDAEVVEKQRQLDSVAAIMSVKTNRVCADCCAADPEWASINLGVLLCIECSGIHRSLGSHISKVRSLTLDGLSAETMDIISLVGNDRSNQVWEHTLQAGWNKPTSADPRHMKEQWIRSKYQWRGFVEFKAGRTADEREAEVGLQLYEAAGEGNIGAALQAIAVGAKLNWVCDVPGNKVVSRFQLGSA